MTADGLTVAVEDYQRAQDQLVGATGYPADLVLRICRDAGVSRRSRG
jgi:hypothetical protein